ncbi:AAA family ATPase, partial [Candidatus Peregrinibacteria bacterium]|nr:AAA family ATPase [Candidatus Peregrinibacteria bacterium]
SEFMERHNTSRLVGATAGYVGYEDGGQLTEAVRRKPYSVILFDEIEKAHPDVFNLLLQILEDGELTDSKGRKVDFKNTIIVMTSNIGAKRLTDGAAPIGFQVNDKELDQAEKNFDHIKEGVMEDLKQHFRPEFLNRIDKIVMFRPLTHDHIKKIVKMHVGYLEDRLKKKDISIELTNGGLEQLAKLSYDPHFGARPVRRKVQELVEDELTQRYLDGDFKDGDLVKIVKSKDGVKLQKGQKAKSAPKAKTEAAAKK